MGICFHGYYTMLSSVDMSIHGQSLYQYLLFLWIILHVWWTLVDVDLLNKEIDKKTEETSLYEKKIIILHVCLNNFSI